jgi:HlyD family secretion protein
MYKPLKNILKAWPIIAVAFVAWAAEDIWLKSSPSRVTLSNILEAKDVKISSKVSGRISTILIKEGDIVKKGQKLLILDGEEIKAQYDQSVANSIKAEMELKDLIMGARVQEIIQAESEKEKAQELLNQSKAKYKNSLLDYNRISELYHEGAVSKQTFDKAEMQKNFDENEVFSREKNLINSIENESLVKEGPRKDHVKASQANVSFSKAKTKEFKNYVDELTVISPLDGEVSSFDLKEGEVIKANQILATVTDLSDVFVRVYVSSLQLGKIKIREKVKIKADAFPIDIFDGVISYIGAQAEFTPRNIQTQEERTKLVYPVKVQIENKDNKLRDGMYITVEL